MSLCTGLNTDTMESIKLDKVMVRFLKNGDDEVKTFAKLINENAAAQSKREADTSKVAESVKATKSTDNKEKEIKREPQLAAGVKRPRPAEGPTNPAAKRVASATPTTTISGKGGLLKRPPTTSAANATSAANVGAAKPKGHQVVSKAPANFFSGLQSASKKPGTALAGAKPKATGPQEKKGSASSTPTARPAFSFAATMANLTRVREPESSTSKPEIKRPPESPEEKAKRLRKEERRKLRVSWKPDAILVDIREFSRDPSEIAATNMRDVRNGGKEKEGLMFKQHMEKMDVDEDDDQPMEQTFFDFKLPTSIDFSSVDEDARKINFEPFGGGQLKVDSPERAVQENREASTLMAVYMVKSDIPPCPREPADPYTGERLETKQFALPEEPFFLRRQARLQPSPTPVVDVQTLLASLQGVIPPVQTQHPVQDSNAALQNLLSQATSKPFSYSTVQTQAPAFPESGQLQATANPNSIEAILAQLGAHNQPEPTSAPVLQFPTATTSTPMDPNAILAALLSQTQTQPQPNPYQALPQTNTPPDQYDQPNVKRHRDGGNQQYGKNEQPGGKRQKWAGKNNPKKDPPKFLYTCRFWLDGKCNKGKDCTFKHEV
jgi:hypothetical protein